MSRDPLQPLLKFRRSAVEEAQKAITDAYRVEQEAIAAVRIATEALDLEMREASSLTAGDEAVEAFVRWLPTGRRRISDAHVRQNQATAELDRVRTILMLAQAAVRSVETLIQQKTDLEIAADRRREQSELDEFAIRREQRMSGTTA